MRHDAVLALAGVLATCAAAQAAGADETFFRRCEVERRAALVGADGEAIARLFADGAQYGHSNGETDDAASLARKLASGELRYRSIVADSERYACHESGYEVTGTQTLGVSANGRELTLRSRFRATWIRVAGACSLAAYQSSPLAATPAK